MRRFHLFITGLTLATLLLEAAYSRPVSVWAAALVQTSTLPASINGQENVLPWLSVFFTDPVRTNEKDQNLDDYIVY